MITEIITAVGTLITAVGGVILAFTVLIPIMRKTRALEITTATMATKTDEVHVLVNSNYEAMLRREEVLISALQRAGVDVPPDEAIALRTEE